MSFQATEWARGLPLPTISAKFTLMMIGSYAGTDGTAFPSLTTLAEDTLQSAQTVRRRIRELEQLGLLVKLSRWTSPDGSVVLTQPGDDSRPPGCRQSSDELRLQLKVTAEHLLATIERLGLGNNEAPDQGDAAAEIDSGEGVNLIPSPAATALTGGGFHSSDTLGVSSESNPLKRLSNSSEETLPPAPFESEGGKPDLRHYEARKLGLERLGIIEPIWPDPITNADRAVAILGALTDDEWGDCQIGVKGYAAFLRSRSSAGKERIAKDFHNWARNRQWAGYLTKGAEVEQAGKRVSVAIDSPEGRAWATIHRLGRAPAPFESGGRYLLSGPMSAQLLAFADIGPETEWLFIPGSQTRQVGAWLDFLRHALAGRTRAELIAERNWRRTRLEDGSPGPLERIKERGFMAPWPWPPGKDGKIYTTGPPEAEVA